MQVSSEVDAALKTEIVKEFRAAAERGEQITFSPQGKPVSLFALIENVTDEYIVIGNSIPPLMLPYVLGASSFQVLCGVWWVRCQRLDTYGCYLKIPFDSFGRMEIARAKERVSFAEREDAKVRIRHPFDSGTWLVRRLYDYSEGGMSFRSRINTPFMQPNRTFDCIETFWGGELRAKNE
jgi:hypothetical protein